MLRKMRGTQAIYAWLAIIGLAAGSLVGLASLL